MPAIVSITAKILGLVDYVLDAWVNVEFDTVATGACSATQINYEVTECGAEIVLFVQQMVYFILQLGGYMLPALGAIPGPANGSA